MRRRAPSRFAPTLLAAWAIASPPARASDPPPAQSNPAQSIPAPSAPAPRTRLYAVPNFAFDTDDGLGFGARGELAFEAPGYTPYRTSYVLHAFVSLRGYHHHRFRFDRTGLGPGRRLRFTLHVAWRQWLNDGYWGLGNTTTRERAFVGSFDDEDPRRKRYRYSLFQPFVHATLRAQLGRAWSLFGSLNVKYSVIATYPGSLLGEQRPFGFDGGVGVILTAGVLYDTRAPEVNSRRGVFAELSARAALPVPGGIGAGVFGGVFASVRAFTTPWARLTLAARLMAEILLGDIPFYEMVHWGGAIPVAGFGGAETLRGINFGRWHSPGKAVLNAEARLKIGEHSLLGRPLAWQLGIFGDVGTTFGAADTLPSGGPPIHPGAGLGIRAIFDELFVGRIDCGVGLDPIREADGSITNTANLGFYIVFDQAF